MKKITSLFLAVVMFISTFAISTNVFAASYYENPNNLWETAYNIGLNENISINSKATYDKYGLYTEHCIYFCYIFYAPTTDYYDFTVSGMAQYPEAYDEVYINGKCNATNYSDIECNYNRANAITITVLCQAGQPTYIEVSDFTSNSTDYNYSHNLTLNASNHIHDYNVYNFSYYNYVEYDYYCKNCDYYYVSRSPIKPKKATIKKVSSTKKKTAKITWKKLNCSGYQIQLATDKKFKKNKKTVNVSGAAVNAKDVKGLKAKKKYYVRVRAYNVVEGKKYYGSWSAVKTVKTK